MSAALARPSPDSLVVDVRDLEAGLDRPSRLLCHKYKEPRARLLTVPSHPE